SNPPFQGLRRSAKLPVSLTCKHGSSFKSENLRYRSVNASGSGKPTLGIGKPDPGIGRPTPGIGKPDPGIGRPTGDRGARPGDREADRGSGSPTRRSGGAPILFCSGSRPKPLSFGVAA